MAEHELKAWPRYFDRIVSGEKTFEVRKNDRDFQTGDTLKLVKYDPDSDSILTPTIWVRVTYVMHGGQFGLEPGYVVMGIEDDSKKTVGVEAPNG